MPDYLDFSPDHALHLWMDAQIALDHAIQRYFESTVVLHSIIRSGSNHSEWTTTCKKLTKLWDNGPPVPDRHAKLAEAQIYINQTRNSLQPVNTLPLEVLLPIFRLSAFRTFHSHYGAPIPFSNQLEHDDHRDLVGLTHVCSDWRNVLLAEPSFWSRFSLEPGRPLESEWGRAEVYSIRASGLPQSLSINDSIDKPLSPIYHCNFMNRVMRPRFDTLTQLSLLGFMHSQFVRDTIHFWLRGGTPGVLRALTIQMHSDMTWAGPIHTKTVSLPARIESMLSPIQALSLRGMRFAWDDPIYRNLTVLRIGNVRHEDSPTLSQILRILSGCALLQTLQLYSMEIHSSDSTSPKPVYLANLDDLDLAALSSNSLAQLLPNIFPGSKDLSLRFAVSSWGAEGFGTIHHFLARTNTTRLYIQKCDDPEFDYVIGRCLSVLPNLHTLIVDLGMQSGDVCLSHFSILDESTGRYIPRCPRLHTMYFVTGSVSIPAVQNLVGTHPLLRKLRFSACYIDPFEDVLCHLLDPVIEDVKSDLRSDTELLSDWYHFMN
ncbi:F-box-like [Rhizoctonia solani]|uniref:F-box-like n=1 Tax=Rhizoctonia solani TaxID=456999 RepID=A0A8H7LL69_9AGAM|nr:F-box-like [Rhizoctonia solani]